jgi:ABC-type transport system involved in cytochrome c biogenesis permease subunit
MKNTQKAEKKWQRWLPWAVTIIMACWVVGSLRLEKAKSAFDLEGFSKLPALLSGRIQPMDSVARNALLILRGKSTVLLTDRPQEQLGFFDLAKIKKMTATEWLLEAMTRPAEADKRYIFRIDNFEVLDDLKLSTDRKFFTFSELEEGWQKIQTEANDIREKEIPEQTQTVRQKAVVKLNSALGLYFRIKNSLRPENVSSFTEELQTFQKALGPALEAVKRNRNGDPVDEAALAPLAQFFRRYQTLAQAAYPMNIPPHSVAKGRDEWMNIGQSLMETIRGGEIQPAVLYYAKMADTYGSDDAIGFNAAVRDYASALAGTFAPEVRKGGQERFFNHYEPFIKAMSIYLLAFLFGCGFWVNLSEWVRKTGFRLMLLGLLIHTSGLVFRMYLEARPPVTNLYSSAIFVGWGGAVLGAILERVWRNGIGLVVSSVLGFVTLIIAHNLALGGDTMEMMRAVLDNNFWLATHVVVITLGYSSMFVAGLLAVIYILRGFFTPTLLPDTRKNLTRMVYGIVCFATLFSFVGTILGGIWADQSWGRFWGWDPKENGALLIVIWCAVVLHARWGGLVRERGMMGLAIFGNIVTGFSWFGVNMLGVGLHSYGFMDKAFKWLMAFNFSQVFLICLCLVPLRYWRSFRNSPTQSAPAPKRSPEPAGLAGAKPLTA